jgi:hypothetical protein
MQNRSGDVFVAVVFVTVILESKEYEFPLKGGCYETVETFSFDYIGLALLRGGASEDNSAPGGI